MLSGVRKRPCSRNSVAPTVLLAICSVMILSPAGADAQEDVQEVDPGEIVYYFVDSGCRDCVPDEELERGDYWIVTSTIRSAAKEELEAVAETYRTALRQRFDNPESLTDNVVVRFRDTEAQAREGREAKIERMRSRGYRIIEIAMAG